MADPLGFDGEVDRTARVPAFVGGAFAPESRRHFGKERLQPDWERFDAPERPLIMGVGRKSWIVDQQHYAPIRVLLERCGEQRPLHHLRFFFVGRNEHGKRRYRGVAKFFQHPSRRGAVAEPSQEVRQARQLVHQAPPDEQRDDQHKQDLAESARNVAPIGHFPEDGRRFDCEERARYRRDGEGDKSKSDLEAVGLMALPLGFRR